MRKNQVKVGGMYVAKVSDKLVTVRIDSTHTAGGWHATNTATGKRIRIKSAQRLRGPAKGGAKTEANETPKAAAAKEAKTRAGRPEAGGADAPKASRTKPSGLQSPVSSLKYSALDAAAQVLKSAGKPMRAQELIAAMAEQNLWKSPGGATPHATLYTAWTMLAKAA